MKPAGCGQPARRRLAKPRPGQPTWIQRGERYMKRSEVRGQRSEVRGQRSEVRGQRSRRFLQGLQREKGMSGQKTDKISGEISFFCGYLIFRDFLPCDSRQLMVLMLGKKLGGARKPIPCATLGLPLQRQIGKSTGSEKLARRSLTKPGPSVPAHPHRGGSE